MIDPYTIQLMEILINIIILIVYIESYLDK